MCPPKERKPRRDSQNKDDRKQRRPSRELPTETKPKIEIIKPNGVSPIAQKPAPVSKVQVVRPTRTDFKIEMTPEAIQAQKERKISHTYTLEEMKAMRHDNDVSDPSVFQFHAELQLYKRYMINGGNRRRSQIQMSDAPILQHKINTILSKFNITTFQSVFNEICSLGINSDVFVLSYVNVVFKQAVLNPQLAFLFSLLSKNVIYVQKHTRFAEKMKSLFLERCNESFVVPKADTDKSTLFLLVGIVKFAGHMIRDEVVKGDLLTNWGKLLIEAGSVSALRLLINLLIAGGSPIFKGHEDILKSLKEKMATVEDGPLLQLYDEVKAMYKEVEPTVVISKELSNPMIARSPSMDTSLDGKYNKLFKKSDSIPTSLADLAEGLDEDDDTIDGAVATYFLSTDASNFVTTIERLGYKEGTVEAAIELLNAIIRQPEQNHLVITQLAVELIKLNFYTVDILKDAMKAICHEEPEDEKAGDVLARIFAYLVNDKYASFDDFEGMFADMMPIWKYVVPKFLFEIENLKGEISDDIADSEFWSTLKFTDSDETADKATILNLWGILNIFPEYEAFAKLEEQKTGSEFAKTAIELADQIRNKNFYGFILEAALELPEAEQGKAIAGLKAMINKNKAAFNAAAEKLGDKAKALLK